MLDHFNKTNPLSSDTYYQVSIQGFVIYEFDSFDDAKIFALMCEGAIVVARNDYLKTEVFYSRFQLKEGY